MAGRERRSKSESKGIIHRLVLGRVVQLQLVPLQEVAPEAQQHHKVCNIFPILFPVASSMNFKRSSVVLGIPTMGETTLLQCPRSKRTARSASHFSLCYILMQHCSPILDIAVPAEAGPTRAKSPAVRPIQPHEIVAALPTTGEGISAGVLMKMFSKRVGEQPNQTTRTEFIQLVKENTKYGPDKLLRRKDS